MELSARELIDGLCGRIVATQQVVDNVLGDPEALSVRIECYGKIEGLRTALCLVMGWDPDQEARHEGLADEYVRRWQDGYREPYLPRPGITGQ